MTLSMDLISLLIESLSRARILLLCVYRPGREYPTRRLAEIAGPKGGGALLRAAPAPVEPAAECAARGLAPGQLRAAGNVLGFILDRAQGNPFFIEETVRSLIDNGVLYQEDGCWRARTRPLTPGLRHVRSVILSRFDRLDAAAQGGIAGGSGYWPALPLSRVGAGYARGSPAWKRRSSSSRTGG